MKSAGYGEGPAPDAVNGRAVEWDPAYLELIDRFSLDGSRHLNISVLQGRNKAISKTLQSGMLCVALLADSLRVPKSATIEQVKRHQGTRKPKKDYVQVRFSVWLTTVSKLTIERRRRAHLNAPRRAIVDIGRKGGLLEHT